MTNSEKYYGNYLGIVVQNNDPEKRGRIKVFVPHVSYSLYENWSQQEVDKVFTGVQDESVSNIVGKLKEVLPWSEMAGPLFGGNASGRYNANIGKSTTSNGTIWTKDGVQGSRPASGFTGPGALHDAFNDGGKTGITNPYSFEYTPSDYSNLAAGMFTVPNVGAHVWVFFEGGDHNSPVYWASSYGEQDVKRVYTTVKFTDSALSKLGSDAVNSANVSVDYPGDYENTTGSDNIVESQTFRAKHVINTNKHAIELVDTDNREILKLTHFSGSFKEWNNFTTTEFASNNDQKMVLGDSFETVRKNKGIAVTGNFRLLVDLDRFSKVGDWDLAALGQVKEFVTKMNEYKQLFDTRRVGRLIYGRRNGRIDLGSVTGVNALSPFQSQEVHPDLGIGLKSVGGLQFYNGFIRCPVCKNKPYTAATDKWVMSEKWIYAEDSGSTYPTGITTGTVAAEDSVLYKPAKELEKKTAFTDTEPGIGYIQGAKCDICNSDYLAQELRRPGFSPSTEFGLFSPELYKTTDNPSGLHSFYNQNKATLNNLLSKLVGGDEVKEVHGNKVETIGLMMNDSMSYRVDPIGKIRAESVYVSPEGVYVAGKPSPHVEVVDVMDIPGGNYILTAGNKFKLIVGAKGVNIKTFGPLDMYGGVVNFTGEQINIGSQNEINFDAGEKLMIRARKTTIVSKDHEPVLIESPLHVSRNAIIQGGAYIEGELGVKHISTIAEIAYTSGPIDDTNGTPHTPSYVQSGVYANDAAGIYAMFTSLANHMHMFYRVPTKFFDCAESLRGYLNDPSQHGGGTINSRQNTVAALAAAGISGPYFDRMIDIIRDQGVRHTVVSKVNAAYNAAKTYDGSYTISWKAGTNYTVPPGGAANKSDDKLTGTLDMTFTKQVTRKEGWIVVAKKLGETEGYAENWDTGITKDITVRCTLELPIKNKTLEDGSESFDLTDDIEVTKIQVIDPTKPSGLSVSPFSVPKI